MDPQTQQLAALFEQTIVGVGNGIANVSNALDEQSRVPGFIDYILNILNIPDIDVGIKQAGVIYLKNMVNRGWSVTGDGEAFPISEGDRQALKQSILQLMVQMPTPVRVQLGVVVQTIGFHDFPEKWPGIVENSSELLNTKEFPVLEGAFFFIDSLLRRYREVSPSKEIYEQIQSVLDKIVQQVIGMLGMCISTLHSEGESQGIGLVKDIMQVLKHILNIMLSLSYLDIPESFEEKLDDIYGTFVAILSYESETYSKVYPVNDDDTETPLDNLQALVCEIITHYEKNYEEHSGKYLGGLLSTIGAMLSRCGRGVRYDPTVTAAIGFLSQIAQSATHVSIFESSDTHKILCEQIIIPNMKLNDDEEDVFEDNPFEYIRMDLEQAVGETRRSSCSELCKGLCKFYQESFTKTAFFYVEALISQYNADRSKWREKDVAVFLFQSIAVQHTSHAKVGTLLNEFVDVPAFFSAHIAPEIAARGSSSPILRSSCLRFFSFFRTHIPREVVRSSIPALFQLIASPSCVIHSYAAAVLDKLLMARQADATGRKTPIVTSDDLQPLVQQFLVDIFTTFGTEVSKVNGYLMACLKRVIMVMKEGMAQFAGDLIDRLNAIIIDVCKNTSIPEFSRNLFETIAALIRCIARKDAQTITQFENLLFPPFQHILNANVVELFPFAFQIFAQMLEIKKPPISDAYAALFGPLLTPALWESSNKGNIPALVRLLSAYFEHDWRYVVTEQKALGKILLVFQKLVTMKGNEVHGTELMKSIFIHVDISELRQFCGDIIRLLLESLSKVVNRVERGMEGAKNVLHYLELFSIMIDRLGGGDEYLNILDGIQPGLGAMILGNIWMKYSQYEARRDARCNIIIGMSYILGSKSMVTNENFAALYGPLLVKVMELIELLPVEDEEFAVEDDELDMSNKSYSSEYVRLRNAARLPVNAFPHVDNPRAFLARSIRKVSENHQGQLPAVIQQHLPDDVLNRLLSYFVEAGIGEPFIL